MRPVLPLLVLAASLPLGACTGARNEGQRRTAQAEEAPARKPVTEQPYVASPGEHFLRVAEEEQARRDAEKAEQAAQNAARAGAKPSTPKQAGRPVQGASFPEPAPMPAPEPAPLPAPAPADGACMPRPGICDAPSVVRGFAPEPAPEAGFTRQAPVAR